ncbi:transposase-like protein [Paraburkholderia youngii]
MAVSLPGCRQGRQHRDFLLRARRDKAAARAYFEKAIDQNGAPETVTLDKSGSNLAALQAINARRNLPIKVRQKKYLNNIVEQDHRAIKRRTRPMLGFKKFRCARILLGGIEIMHMIVKGQLNNGGVGANSRTAVLFTGWIRTPYHVGLGRPLALTATEPACLCRMRPDAAMPSQSSETRK